MTALEPARSGVPGGADPVPPQAPAVTVTDARLLLPAVAAWAAAAVAPALRPHLSLQLAALTGVVGLLAVLAARREGLRVVVAVSIVCAAGGLAAVGVRASATSSGPLAALARTGAGATVDAVLTADPYAIPVAHGQLWLLDARAERLRSGPRAYRLRQPVLVLATGPAWGPLLPSTRVRLAGVLAPPRPGDTVAAVVRVRGDPEVIAGPSAVQRVAGRLRAGLRTAAQVLPGRERGLLPGLVDGDVAALPPALAAQFKVDGLTHLVAVSGSNVVAVLAAALLLARTLRLGRAAPALAAVLLVCFVVLARPSPSVLRAAVMGLIALGALAGGRQRPAVPALAATVLILLLVDPALAVSPGFALSTLASAALLLLAPGWRGGLIRRGWSPTAAEAVAVPLAAQVVCGPVIAVFAGSVSLVAVAANLVAAPAVPLATVAGVCAAVVAPVCLPLAHVAAWVAGVPCWWLVTVAAQASRIPAAQVPWPTGAGGGLLLVAVSVVALAVTRAGIRAVFPVAAATAVPAPGAVPTHGRL